MDETTTREFSGGLVASVRADGDVVVQHAGALAVVAGGSATIRQGGAGLCVIGGDMTMSEAGAGNMIVGGNAELSEAGVGQLVALEAHVRDSRVGLLVGGSVTMESSEVMFTTAQAAALGVAAGGVLFVLSRLFRRR